MDGPDKIILEISSDEEVGWGESGLTSAGDGDAGGRDDGDWLAELLDEFHRKADDSSDNVLDDSDEVVVIEEILHCKKRKVEKPSVKWEGSVDDDDDDDCVVLDGDPDKPVEVNDGGGGDDSDDLMLVSEKGQVACRDYPHPRHLCVKFAFSYSPHEMHCDQCHCYVCDSLAPCVHWGTGISSIDHCHATDKDEFWKSQRKSSKNRRIAHSVVPNATNTSLSVRPTDITQSTSLLNNVLNQGNFRQAGRQPGSTVINSTTTNATMHRRQPCAVATIATAPNLAMHRRHPSSMATNATIPNVTMRGRMQPSKCNTRNKFQHQLVSQSLQSAGSADPRLTSSRMPWKGPRTAGPLMTNGRHHYNLSGNNFRLQLPINHPPATRWPGSRHPVTSSLEMLQNPHQANLGVIHEHAGSSLSTHPDMGGGLASHASSPHCQVSPQTYISGVNANLVVPQSQWSSQNYVPSISGNSMRAPHQIASQPYYNAGFQYMPIQSQAASQSKVPQNPVPYQHEVSSPGNTHSSLHAVSAQPSVSSLSKAAEVSQNPVPYPHQVPSSGNTPSSLNAEASQPAVHCQPSFSSLLESQISNLIGVRDPPHSVANEGNQTETGWCSSSADIGAGWNSHTMENNKNIASFSSLLESQISDQIGVRDLPHSVANEGNQTETGWCSTSADIGVSWNSHTMENNENIAGSSQQLHTAIPAANGDPQTLAKAVEFEFDDWILPHDRALDLDSLEIPVLPQPNILSPESSHINANSLFDF